jgi:hypothetical protein
LTVFQAGSTQAQSGLWGSITVATSSDTNFTSYITKTGDNTYSFQDQFGDPITITQSQDGKSATMSFDGESTTFDSTNNSLTFNSGDGSAPVVDYISNSGVAAQPSDNGTAYLYPNMGVTRDNSGASSIEINGGSLPDIFVSATGQLSLVSSDTTANPTVSNAFANADGTQTALWGESNNPALSVNLDASGWLTITQPDGSGGSTVSTLSPQNVLTVNAGGTDKTYNPPILPQAPTAPASP